MMPRVVTIQLEKLQPEEILAHTKRTPATSPVKGVVEKKPKVKQELITDHLKVEKKRRSFDRFHGTPKEELLTRTLPDRLKEGLDIVFIGINPGLFAAYKQHYYAGPGNHFWKCLFLSGLVPEPMGSDDDESITNFGIGFTNMVSRTTPGSADLTRTEIKEGSKILLEKMQLFKPRIVVFNGKGIYEVFNSCFGDKNKNFPIGKQPHFFPGTESFMYVVPSSSARCAQLPRAIDKVPFYAALRKFRDYLRGDLATLDENEVMFPDLEMVAAPVEPVARAAFLEEKRLRDEEKRAERARVKMEKKIKEEGEAGQGALGAGTTKRRSCSPKGAKEKGQRKQRKTKSLDPSQLPPSINVNLQSLGSQKQKQQQPPHSINPATFVKTEVDSNASSSVPQFVSTPPHLSISSLDAFQNSPNATLPLITCPILPPNHSTSDLSSPMLALTSPTSSPHLLTSITPDLKQEDPHLLSTLQLLNANRGNLFHQPTPIANGEYSRYFQEPPQYEAL